MFPPNLGQGPAASQPGMAPGAPAGPGAAPANPALRQLILAMLMKKMGAGASSPPAGQGAAAMGAPKQLGQEAHKRPMAPAAIAGGVRR